MWNIESKTFIIGNKKIFLRKNLKCKIINCLFPPYKTVLTNYEIVYMHVDLNIYINIFEHAHTHKHVHSHSHIFIYIILFIY